MEAKNINIDQQYPKSLGAVDLAAFDLIVNMSGTKLPARISIEVRDWRVPDPIGQSQQTYEVVRDQIEHLVMRLILDLRRAARHPQTAAGERPTLFPKKQKRGSGY